MEPAQPLHSARGQLTGEVLEGPSDFDDFWLAAYTEARAVDPRPRRVRELQADERWVLSEVRFQGAGGVDLGAYLLEPRGQVDRLAIGLAGYGGAHGPYDPLRVPGVAELSPAVRGMPALSTLTGVPSTGTEHVLHGIDSREGYIIRGCVQDVWTAVSAAQKLFPGAGRVDLRAGSFGGGLGALALPWEDRITSAALAVPTFGNHPARLRTPCTGSGESVRLLAQREPSIIQTIRYFDAATAAARITIPVLVGAARVDPAVPPVGQFAVYEALSGPHALFEYTAGHTEFDGLERERATWHGASRGWLGL